MLNKLYNLQKKIKKNNNKLYTINIYIYESSLTSEYEFVHEH